MSYKGGYQIIDLGGIKVNTGSTGVLYPVEGILEKISNTKKTIMLTNFILDEEVYNNCFAFVSKNNNATYLTIGSEKFEVRENGIYYE